MAGIRRVEFTQSLKEPELYRAFPGITSVSRYTITDEFSRRTPVLQCSLPSTYDPYHGELVVVYQNPTTALAENCDDDSLGIRTAPLFTGGFLLPNFAERIIPSLKWSKVLCGSLEYEDGRSVFVVQGHGLKSSNHFLWLTPPRESSEKLLSLDTSAYCGQLIVFDEKIEDCNGYREIIVTASNLKSSPLPDTLSDDKRQTLRIFREERDLLIRQALVADEYHFGPSMSNGYLIDRFGRQLPPTFIDHLPDGSCQKYWTNYDRDSICVECLTKEDGEFFVGYYSCDLMFENSSSEASVPTRAQELQMQYIIERERQGLKNKYYRKEYEPVRSYF